MSEQLRESLSAAMDDEADAFELRRVLDEAQGDDELRAEWQRLHMISDLLHETPQAYAPGLRDALWEELLAERADNEAESADLVPLDVSNGGSGKSRGNFWGRIAGGVVAASVALVVVLNGDLLQDELRQGTEPVVDSQIYVPSQGMQVVSGEITPADRQRRNAYYIQHAQFRGMHQIGVASFTKLATFDEAGMQTGED